MAVKVPSLLAKTPRTMLSLLPLSMLSTPLCVDVEFTIAKGIRLCNTCTKETVVKRPRPDGSG